MLRRILLTGMMVMGLFTWQAPVVAVQGSGTPAEGFSSLSDGDTTSSGARLLREQVRRIAKARLALRDSVLEQQRRALAAQGMQLNFTRTIFGLKGFKPVLYPEWYHPTWEMEMRKRATGGQNLLLSPALLLAQFSPRDEWERSQRRWKNDFIPSDLQLHVLNTLWQEGVATQNDIYRGLDTLYTITAEQLDRQLERMVRVGLVERKIISPQNLFTILSPIRRYQIEMSAKNRRNRVYLYRPRVERKQVLQFLLARNYLVRSGDVGSPGEEKKLARKIKIILPAGFR